MIDDNQTLIMDYKEYRAINTTLRRELDAIHNKLDEIIDAKDISDLNDLFTDTQFLINTYHSTIVTAVYIHYLRKKSALE